MEPSSVERQHGELVEKIDALTREVAALRTAGSGG
jgi:hypothetical protein